MEESGIDDSAAMRMGRFRVCSPNSPGPPETRGRFRVSSQSNGSKPEENI